MYCEHQKTKIILLSRELELQKCSKCGLIFYAQKTFSNMKEIYDVYYQKETGGRFNFGLEYFIKAFRFWRALKIFFKKNKAKSILDIGSGRGWTLYFLKNCFKYEAVCGIQISQNAYMFSKERLGLNVFNQDFLELNFKKRFNIITLWHTLEHINDLQKYADKISQSLTPGGLLIIEVPNFNSWTRLLTGKHWLALDPTHHITFFTPNSLKRLLSRRNFKIRSINTFSLEYSTFTSMQSIINLITGSDNYFFNGLQKGKINLAMFLHAFLFFLILLPCFLVNVGLYFSRKGEVINIVAEKQQ